MKSVAILVSLALAGSAEMAASPPAPAPVTSAPVSLAEKSFVGTWEGEWTRLGSRPLSGSSQLIVTEERENKVKGTYAYTRPGSPGGRASFMGTITSKDGKKTLHFETEEFVYELEMSGDGGALEGTYSGTVRIGPVRGIVKLKRTTP